MTSGYPRFPVNIAERKIAAALKTAAAHCRAGDHPDEALWKAAGAHGLNPDMLARTGEMLNISLTHAHFERAADKTASFPTADSAAVTRRLFIDGDEPVTDGGFKHAGSSVEFTPDAPVAAVGADARFFAAVTGGGNYSLAKSAAVTGTEHEFFTPKSTPLPEHATGIIRESLAKRAEWKRAADEARATAGREFNRAMVTLAELEVYFSRVDNLDKYAAFEDQAYGEYGEEIAPFLELVRGALPRIDATQHGDPAYAKRARAWTSNRANSLLDDLVATEGRRREATAEHQRLQHEYAVKSAALDVAVRELDAPAPVKTASERVGDKLDFSRLNLNKRADGGAPEASAERLRKLVGFVDRPGAALVARQSHLEKGYAAGQEAHAHAVHRAPVEQADAELANVRREGILRDLMTNDEIIANHDPAHIQQAYNGILSTSPELTTNREVLRSILRQSTATQSLDPFAAKQLADLGKTTLENQNLRSGKKPDGSPV